MAVDKDFKLENDVKTRIQNAQNIVVKYVTEGAQLEINIDSQSKRKLVEAVNNLSMDSTNFDGIFDEVYK
jgi:hypothetical protein